MAISPDKYEIGSSGYVWQNILPDSLLNNLRLHVYYAHEMHTDSKWVGNEYVNHYNRIYWVRSGKAVLQFDGFEMQMRPDHLYLIPPYTLKSHYTEGNLYFYWAHFHALTDGDLDFIALFGQPSEHKVESIDDVTEAFNRLVDSVKRAEGSETLWRNMLIAQLIQPFITDIFKQREQLNQRNHIRFLPALASIEKGLSGNITVADLARSMDVSIEHFSRQFKEVFKITPKRYILKKRMNLAKQLLLLGNQAVIDIALECGFCDQYYFSKSFKQEEGCSPSQYRKNYLQQT